MSITGARHASLVFRLLAEESLPDRGVEFFGKTHPLPVRVARLCNTLRAHDPGLRKPVDGEVLEREMQDWFTESRRRETLGWVAAELLRRSGVSERRLTELTGAHRNTVHRKTRQAAALADAVQAGIDASSAPVHAEIDVHQQSSDSEAAPRL